MVVLNKIYTRTGDAGTTALGNGDRVAKHNARVETYGTTDELNCFVGVARLEATGEMDAALSLIQNDLFDLGADLCRPDMAADAQAEYPPLRMAMAQVERLEAEVDDMIGNDKDHFGDSEGASKLEPLRSFILPGGSKLSAHLHVCRTVARRAERLAVLLADQEDINPAAVKYLNRLSDWFFVAARVANNYGKDDVLWVPGANR